MSDGLNATQGRRALLKGGLVLAGALATPGAVMAGPRRADPLAPLSSAPPPVVTSPRLVRPQLLKQALAALDRHAAMIPHRDRVAIADFAAPSSQPRFHVVDLASGESQSFLVAHGSGSDPAHTGWLERFSNDPGSNASCQGAFLASDYYVGHHGRSQRLQGLDATNSNALSRAIVVHSAWYSNPEMLRTHGMLGRSQGCFAVGEADLPRVFDRLGEGRMIFAAKV